MAALDKAFGQRRDLGLIRFQMLTGDTLAISYSSWVIQLRNSLAHERQINLSVVAVGRSVVAYWTLEDLFSGIASGEERKPFR